MRVSHIYMVRLKKYPLAKSQYLAQKYNILPQYFYGCKEDILTFKPKIKMDSEIRFYQKCLQSNACFDKIQASYYKIW